MRGIALAAIGLIPLPAHLASYRERGVLKRFHASPVPAWAALGSRAIVGLVAAQLGSLLSNAVGVAATRRDLRTPPPARHSRRRALVSLGVADAPGRLVTS